MESKRNMRQFEANCLMWIGQEGEPQLSGKKLGNTCKHPLPGTLGLYVYVTVVCVTAKRMPPSLQFLVQIIEQDIGEQRREWASLRSPFYPGRYDTSDHQTCLKVAAYKF